MKHPGNKRAERGDMLLIGIGVALVLFLMMMGFFLFSNRPVQTMPAQPQANPPAAVAPLQIQQVDPTDDADAPVAEEPAEEPNQ